MEWIDRHQSQKVDQAVQRTLGGGLIVYHRSLFNGQSITLAAQEDAGWLTLDQVTALEALAAQAGAVFVIDLNGTEYSVMFRHQDAPAFSAEPFVPRLNEGAQDYFMATIKLMVV